MKNIPSSINYHKKLPPNRRLSYQFLIDFMSSINRDPDFLDTIMAENYTVQGEERNMLNGLYEVRKNGRAIKSDIRNMAQYGQRYAYLTNDDRMMRQGIDEVDKQIIEKYNITKDIYISYLLKIESHIKDLIAEGKDRFRSINSKSTIKRLLQIRKSCFSGDHDQEVFDWVVYSGYKEMFTLGKITYPLHQEYITTIHQKTKSDIIEAICKVI